MWYLLYTVVGIIVSIFTFGDDLMNANTLFDGGIALLFMILFVALWPVVLIVVAIQRFMVWFGGSKDVYNDISKD